MPWRTTVIMTLIVHASGCGDSPGCRLDAEFLSPVEAATGTARIQVQLRNIGPGVCGKRSVQLIGRTTEGELVLGMRRLGPLASQDVVIVAWPEPDASSVELRGEGFRPIAKRISDAGR